MARVALITNASEPISVLSELAEQDVLGQLLQREGQMRYLATEAGDVKLDWVDGVEKALSDVSSLVDVEDEAAAMLRSGIRHVIWAGMGGSVQVVYALCRTGLAGGQTLTIHPLDSTDPASLNRVLLEIAAKEGLEERVKRADQESIKSVLSTTAMLGVSMGMTSEEPITHLEWFDSLLNEYHIPEPGSHIQVMTLPGSYLDDFAKSRGSRMAPIQLDGENHTAGRMSAPATRVFLRPVALTLAASRLWQGSPWTPDGSLVRQVLMRCQELAGIASTETVDRRRALSRTDAFVRLGAVLSEGIAEGRNKLLVLTPDEWGGFAPWLEQLVEESLGKRGKGLLIFHGQDDSAVERLGSDVAVLSIEIGDRANPLAEVAAKLGRVVHRVIVPASGELGEADRMAAMAALCLGFEITVAVFGYLQEIVFAGQPAVEAYKRYARELRDREGPVVFDSGDVEPARLGSLTLHLDTASRPSALGEDAIRRESRRLGGDHSDAAASFAAVLSLAAKAGRCRYLDLTFNGEVTEELSDVLETARRELAIQTLGIPCKLRTGPSDYHSTEQSETDGPDEVVSLRIVALSHDPVLVGQYSDKFLLAQARGTWQAMDDADRLIAMLTLPKLDVSAYNDLRQFFADARRYLASRKEGDA